MTQTQNLDKLRQVIENADATSAAQYKFTEYVLTLDDCGHALIRAVVDPATVEELARIIDPSSWRVMDSYLAETKRKYAGQNVGWPTEQFQHKESMVVALAILEALAAKAVKR